MADKLTLPRPFVLRRTVDVSGVSGTGDVATGCVFPDGTVALRWASATASTVLWNSLEDALAVHGHDGRTTAVFADGGAQAEVPQPRRPVDGTSDAAVLRGALHLAEDELGWLRRRVAELQQKVDAAGVYARNIS